MGPVSSGLMSVPRILILQHTHIDYPAWLGLWLDQQGVAWDVFNTEAGHDYPESVVGYAGLAVLGGEPSVLDPLPSLRKAEALIREADRLGIPVLGHCLGGQLLAHALGGRVERARQPEIGWCPLQIHDCTAARAWFGEVREARVYQWHYDSFVALPPGAELLASSPGCEHQAFAIGPHLGMQFHIEISSEKIREWIDDPGTVYPQALAVGEPWVQSPEQMLADSPHNMPASMALASTIYTRWQALWRV